MPPSSLGERILVVEDEEYVRRSLGELLRARGYEAVLAASVDEALRFLGKTSVDAVLTDLKLPGLDGLEFVRRLRASHPEPPVVVLTGHGTVRSAVECLKAGATDYILKPADPDELAVALERALANRAMRRELDHLRDTQGAAGLPDLPIGTAPAWAEVMKQVRAVAPTDSTVLLLGESGTGKELLARLIHKLSRRAERACVSINCSAVPLEIWESEFFGHRRGAFTGANADRDGRFTLAHRGTLFMDEVGTMPAAAQAKILRVIESGEFERVGDAQPTRVDVRLVAATNSDLQAEVAAGRFRQDLFFRLSVVPIRVPPLRERIDDVPVLVAHFVRDLSARLNRRPPRVADEALQNLRAYSWPGNVRELRNVLERALILQPGDELASADLLPVEALAAPPGSGDPADLNLRTALGATERRLIVEALSRAGGVRKEAARLLGIDPRNLPYYQRKHGIDPGQD